MTAPLHEVNSAVSLRYEKSRKIAQYVAIGFGINLIFGETLRNWGEWPADPKSYAFDYLFALSLVVLGILVRHTVYVALLLMSLVWALTVFLFTWSYLGHIEHIDEPTYGLISQVPLTIIIGVLDLIAMFGFVVALMAIAATRNYRAS